MHLNSEKVYYDFLIESATTRDKKNTSIKNGTYGLSYVFEKTKLFLKHRHFDRELDTRQG